MNTLKHQKEQKSSNSLCKFEGRELVLYAPAGKNHAQDNQQVNAKNTDNFDISNIMSSQTHKHRSGRGNLVERFQPQITGSVGGLVKNYLNG